jgi:predicted metal-binding membrane protein
MPATSGGLHTGHYALYTLAMWFVMMVGMMTPSVAPTVLLFDRINRSGQPGAPAVRSLCFLAGYLTAWFLFSVAATALQVWLIAAGWVDEMGVSTWPAGTAFLLAAVGLYQWLPAKAACLEHCRAPAAFIVTAHRPGARGAFVMGLHHGLYCLGCCWLLMALLFVGGVMNLAWVAAIAALVIVEKLLVRGEWWRKASGAAALLAAVLVYVTR